MNCPVGFLVVETEDGSHVPFFIKTREKEIVYDENLFKANVSSIINPSNYDTITYDKIDHNWKFKKGLWEGAINRDKTFEATYHECILNLFTAPSTAKSNRVDGLSKVLPFSVLNDNKLNVQVSLMTNDYELQSSILTIDAITNNFNKVGLHMCNFNPIFRSNLASQHQFDDSFVFIKVQGKIV